MSKKWHITKMPYRHLAILNNQTEILDRYKSEHFHVGVPS